MAIKVYNFATSEYENIKGNNFSGTYFIHCFSSEITLLKSIFGFDDSTILECTNVDENIRFTSYKDYDFISIIYFGLNDHSVFKNEINLYVGKNYVVLVTPQHSMQHFEQYIFTKIEGQATNVLNRAYYTIFDKFLTDLSEALEFYEDEMILVEENITSNFSNDLFDDISCFRREMYTVKKLIRPILYVCDQFEVNENGFISAEYMRYFRSIDIRANKLYDFSVSLQEFPNQLLNLYESRLSMKTNVVVTRLTALTIIFGPPTVIVGVYGMNFDFMPELSWHFGYPLIMSIILIITIGVIIFFRKNKWL